MKFHFNLFDSGLPSSQNTFIRSINNQNSNSLFKGLSNVSSVEIVVGKQVFALNFFQDMHKLPALLHVQVILVDVDISAVHESVYFDHKQHCCICTKTTLSNYSLTISLPLLEFVVIYVQLILIECLLCLKTIL